jgi:hypothetical protein
MAAVPVAWGKYGVVVVHMVSHLRSFIS